MKNYVLLAALSAGVLFSLSANGNQETKAVQAASSLPGHLVDIDWLSANLDMEKLVILDTARSVEDFNSAHISGAQYADRSAYWKKINGIPGMFPGVEQARLWFEGLGISNDSSVVIYDAGPGLWAARVAWTLAYLGHDDWAVLDGGYAYWKAEGYPLIKGKTPKATRGHFEPMPREELLVSADDIVENFDNPDFVVVDARSPAEYNGTDVRAERGGHIPGSLPIEWKLNNSGRPARLLPIDQVAEFYNSEGVESGNRVVTLCQTGVRGAHTWLALTLAGYEDVALYDGSWAEWAANEDLPVEQ